MAKSNPLCNVDSGYRLRFNNDGHTLALRVCELEGYCVYASDGRAKWTNNAGHEIPAPNNCGGPGPSVYIYHPETQSNIVASQLIENYDEAFGGNSQLRIKVFATTLLVIIILVALWLML